MLAYASMTSLGFQRILSSRSMSVFVRPRHQGACRYSSAHVILAHASIQSNNPAHRADRQATTLVSLDAGIRQHDVIGFPEDIVIKVYVGIRPPTSSRSMPVFVRPRHTGGRQYPVKQSRASRGPSGSYLNQKFKLNINKLYIAH